MKWIFSILLSVIFATASVAQERQDRIKKIEALKAAYITKKLDLTPEEAKSFWPVYNDYQDELGSLYRQKRQNQMINKDNPTEALNNDNEFDSRIVTVKKKYQKEFSKILPAEKILELYKAEREFREELIKELRERRRE